MSAEQAGDDVLGRGGWVAVLDDPGHARAHARTTFPVIQRAQRLVTDITPGTPGSPDGAPNAQIWIFNAAIIIQPTSMQIGGYVRASAMDSSHTK